MPGRRVHRRLRGRIAGGWRALVVRWSRPLPSRPGWEIAPPRSKPLAFPPLRVSVEAGRKIIRRERRNPGGPRLSEIIIVMVSHRRLLEVGMRVLTHPPQWQQQQSSIRIHLRIVIIVCTSTNLCTRGNHHRRHLTAFTSWKTQPTCRENTELPTPQLLQLDCPRAVQPEKRGEELGRSVNYRGRNTIPPFLLTKAIMAPRLPRAPPPMLACNRRAHPSGPRKGKTTTSPWRSTNPSGRRTRRSKRKRPRGHRRPPPWARTQ
mmetsp:Transcript_28276/g.58926  ORF Transcript_28276/g.58926 Transcript_28276/m.58926 type:complete len:262 (-) Transcript_28276:897-1682(-)